MQAEIYIENCLNSASDSEFHPSNSGSSEMFADKIKSTVVLRIEVILLTDSI